MSYQGGEGASAAWPPRHHVHNARVSLKHVHSPEDTGVPGPNSLAWEAPAIATG